MKKNHIIWLILIIGFALRIVFLDRFPTGITNDELHFVLNSKSVFLNHKDLSGSNWNPLSLSTIPREASSELVFLLASPLIGILPLSLLWSKLFFVLIGMGTIFVIYLISKHLFSEPIALLTASVAAFNPWSIYVNRTAFDAPVALFFYLIFIYAMLRLKKWYLILGCIPALIAFYTYIGTKVIFIPIIILTVLYTWLKNKRPFIDPYIVIVIFSTILTSFYIFQLKNSPNNSRISELVSLNKSEIIIASKNSKEMSLRSPFKIIFSSPLSLVIRQSLSKYLNNFSPNVLFLYGDPTYLVSLWQHGYFYILDALFIILGIVYIFKKYRIQGLFICGFILLSPLPEAIRSDVIPAYAFHSVLQYPFIFILIACGIYSLISFKKILGSIVVILYALLFLNFIDIYFFRYPVYQSEGFFLSRRILSHYLTLNQTQTVFVLTTEPESLFRNYLFFNNLIDNASITQINQQYQLNPNRDYFSWGKLIFLNDPKKIDPTAIVVADTKNTQYLSEKAESFIPRLNDPSNLFALYKNPLCDIQKLDFFTHNLDFRDLNIETLNSNLFCSKFIVRPL